MTRQIIACTGKQFCNLALTEARGYGLQLIEDLRRRHVELYGIRIAISGCANACAQHHTADIGLRGVRVRQGLRAVDAFDIHLGGGAGATMTLARLYQKGVPVKRLAETLERIVNEYHHAAQGRRNIQYILAADARRARAGSNPARGNTLMAMFRVRL